MRKIFLLFSFVTTLSVFAQQTPIEKYAIPSHDFQHVFLDHVQGNKCEIIDSNSGEFVGQVNDKHLLYGYGEFVNNDGSQILGMFRNGRLLFGITMNEKSALVGSPEFYASYSLSTGKMEYVFKAEEKHLYDTQLLYDYNFVKMDYANGDQYVGEIYQNKRHGYGIYYYANGWIWFGQYKNDIRSGFGVLFDEQNRLTIGYWEGEDARRIIRVKSK